MSGRWIAIAWILTSVALRAQPQANAPIDVTGYWVSLVTEDWRYRMLNAPKGDYYSIPLNAEGKRVADIWDPAKDIAAGKQCMSYGAPNIMREPARLHITWANDSALKIEIDAGKQTRLFLFAAPHGRWRAVHARNFGGAVADAANRFVPPLRRSLRKIPTRPGSRMPAWRRRRLRPINDGWAEP